MDIKDFLIAHSAGNLYWKDRSGIYLGCNESFAKLLKLKSSKDIIGKTDEDLLHDATLAKEIKKIDKKVITSGKEITTEEIGLDEKGNQAIYLSQKAPIRNNKGKIIGLMGTSLNITEKKQVAALRAEIAKSEFISNMSHDFRTPFSGIISVADALKKTEKDLERKELLDMVLVSGKRLLDLINQVLEITQLGAIPIQKENFNIRELAQAVIDMMLPEIKAKKLDVTLDVPNVNVKTDRFRIHRILINLISNAVRYTKKGCIHVIITVRPKLIIEVQDTGIGIPKDKFEIIFDRFGKVSGSEKSPDFRGLGLGLFMVKQFARELKGHIDVKSQLGKGSSFIFSL